MGFLNFETVYLKAKDAFLRFPIVLSWAILGTLYTMVFIEKSVGVRNFTGELATIVLGISWLIGTRFSVEQLKRPKKLHWLFLLPIVGLIVFWYHLPDLENLGHPIYSYRFVLYAIAGHLFLIVSPFITYWNKNAYWNYLKSTVIAFGRSLLFSMVLYLGLVLALLSIEALFSLDVNSLTYARLFIFCIGIVNTWAYLSDFPKTIRNDKSIDFNASVLGLSNYILMPLVILYVGILYAYSLKIILIWELPKGWVSYLIVSLALLGFLIQTILYPIEKTSSGFLIKKFNPWFYVFLIPLLILLFIAIIKRVSEYGITENRYLLVGLSIWIAIGALYLLINKSPRLKYLPIGLAVFLMLASIGPWSMFNVSLNSQVKRFEKNYAAVVKTANDISREEYQSLSSILNYLIKHKEVHRLNSISGVNLQPLITNKPSDTRSYKYEGVYPNEILSHLNIERPTVKSNDITYKNFYLSKETFKTSIAGFSSLSYIKFNNLPQPVQSDFQVQLIDDSSRAVIKNKDSIIYELDISSLLQKKVINPNNSVHTADELSFTGSFKDFAFKLIIDELTVTTAKDKTTIENLSAYIFIQ